MPRSFPGSASAGGTGAPEAVSDPQEQRGPVPRSRAPHAGGAQYPAAPGDGSVAPSAPLAARPLPAGNVSLGRVPTFLPCGLWGAAQRPACAWWRRRRCGCRADAPTGQLGNPRPSRPGLRPPTWCQGCVARWGNAGRCTMKGEGGPRERFQAVSNVQIGPLPEAGFSCRGNVGSRFSSGATRS